MLNVTGTGEGVSKWLSKVTRKLNGSKSNLTSTKRCKLKSDQLQSILNIVIYSLSIRKWYLKSIYSTWNEMLINTSTNPKLFNL